ncbi:zinc ribbon-containing protein [Marinomonas sp. PE14-40]|uniref:zinc ribbon-containing protein n=1 Tax=Marinomonas sp. PE14-40 TaxID=3060621 RepID=UPI003F662DCC
MKSDKKESKTNEGIVKETRKTLEAAKSWVVDDAHLATAYWHHKMGYMEAWVSAHWHLVLEKGHDALEELEEIEDLGLLWLVDHVNQNPVPLAHCHTAGSHCEAGVYLCMSCSQNQVLKQSTELDVCDNCGYGVFSNHSKSAEE